MAISPDALFSHVLQDVSPYLRHTTLLSLHAEEACGPVAESGNRFEAAARSLVTSFYKKYVEMIDDNAEANSWSKFKRMNDRCANFDTITGGVFRDRSRLQSWDDMLFGEFRKVLHQALYPSSETVYDYDEIFDRGRHGPGASLLTGGCDSYTKDFSCRGSSTSEFLCRHFDARARLDVRWCEALDLRQAQYGVPVLVDGSSLSFVPKSRETMRSICTEPSLNMFYQLGLGSMFEDRLKSGFGIDLALQPDHNRWLTRQGSIDGSFATIDLSSASDTISLTLCERVLDRSLFNVICKLRSKTTSYNGEKLALHMVSTMGNGFTFPLQTLIFASCVIAVYNIMGIEARRPTDHDAGNFGVYGDDIVCESKAYRKVCDLLGKLGFLVNGDKSFSEGPFRESCGQDWYAGYDIRGVYVDSLETRQDIFVLINRLNEFTARTDVSLSRTVNYLLSFVPYQPVPMRENDDAGVKVPLHVVQVRKYNKDVQSIMYKADRVRASPLKIDHDMKKILVPKKCRKRLYNPLGLWLTFLYGGLSVPAKNRPDSKIIDRISIRLDTPIYETKRCVCPNWDYTPHHSAPKAVEWGRRLSDAIVSNLYY
jgi:hypothetical protein